MLHVAAEYGSMNVLAWLGQHNDVDFLVTDRDGRSALMKPALRGLQLHDARYTLCGMISKSTIMGPNYEY